MKTFIIPTLVLLTACGTTRQATVSTATHADSLVTTAIRTAIADTTADIITVILDNPVKISMRGDTVTETLAARTVTITRERRHGLRIDAEAHDSVMTTRHDTLSATTHSRPAASTAVSHISSTLTSAITLLIIILALTLIFRRLWNTTSSAT